jgi:alpha-L-rhamnosidase
MHALLPCQGPVVSDSVYNGESYDAQLEQPGWAAPGFDPATPWSAVHVVTCFDPVLSPLSFPGIGIDEVRPALSVFPLSVAVSALSMSMRWWHN